MRCDCASKQSTVSIRSDGLVHKFDRLTAPFFDVEVTASNAAHLSLFRVESIEFLVQRVESICAF